MRNPSSDQLAAARNGNVQSLLQTEAKTGLSALIGTLNTQVNGAYLFAGINADVKPVAAYDQIPARPPISRPSPTPSPPRSASPQSDPQVANISANDMQNFPRYVVRRHVHGVRLEEHLVLGVGSERAQPHLQLRADRHVRQRQRRRHAQARRAPTPWWPTSARRISTRLHSRTWSTKASTLTAEAIQGLTTCRPISAARSSASPTPTAGMTIQSDIITNHVDALEGVDPYEASSRLTSLMTQIETAYAMTARIQKLSLLNYLRPEAAPGFNIGSRKEADVPVLLRRSARRDAAGRARAGTPGNRALDRAARGGREERRALARGNRGRAVRAAAVGGAHRRSRRLRRTICRRRCAPI